MTVHVCRGDHPVGSPRLCPVGTAVRTRGHWARQDPWVGSWGGTGQLGWGQRHRRWARVPRRDGLPWGLGLEGPRCAHDSWDSWGEGRAGASGTESPQETGTPESKPSGLRPRETRGGRSSRDEKVVRKQQRGHSVPTASSPGLRAPHLLRPSCLDTHDGQGPRQLPREELRAPTPAVSPGAGPALPTPSQPLSLCTEPPGGGGASPRCRGPHTPEGSPRDPALLGLACVSLPFGARPSSLPLPAASLASTLTRPLYLTPQGLWASVCVLWPQVGPLCTLLPTPGGSPSLRARPPGPGSMAEAEGCLLGRG